MGQSPSRRRYPISQNYRPPPPSLTSYSRDYPSNLSPGFYPPFAPNRQQPSIPSASSNQVKASSNNRTSSSKNVKPVTLKNPVNVHKGSIQLESDEWEPDRHLVSFNFDASVDGSFKVYYFAKEEKDCMFSQIYPDMQIANKVPFKAGVHQKFKQYPGTGMDLGFFELHELSNPIEDNAFPLVIYAEVEPNGQMNAKCAQITQAVIERENEGCFRVKVIKQILWANGERYELQDIYGRESTGELEGAGVSSDEKECIICMSEPREIALLPCRHMCMCNGCAKEVRVQSKKCPICRHSIEAMIEIEIQEQA